MAGAFSTNAPVGEGQKITGPKLILIKGGKVKTHKSFGSPWDPSMGLDLKSLN